MNKKDLMLVAVTATAGATLFVGAGFLGYQAVSAIVNASGYPKLIENLAARFNASPETVAQVFEETRKEEYSQRLDQAVNDGRITEEQKTLILNKMTETEARMEEINDEQLSADARREKLQELRTELNKWADDNDIPYRYLMPQGPGFKGEMGMPGFRHGMGF